MMNESLTTQNDILTKISHCGRYILETYAGVCSLRRNEVVIMQGFDNTVLFFLSTL